MEDYMRRIKEFLKNRRNPLLCTFIIVLMLVSNIPANQIVALETGEDTDTTLSQNYISELERGVAIDKENEFRIKAVFDNEAKILNDSRISVIEIENNFDKYEDYKARADRLSGKENNSYRFYNVSIVYDDKEILPEGITNFYIERDNRDAKLFVLYENDGVAPEDKFAIDFKEGYDLVLAFAEETEIQTVSSENNTEVEAPANEAIDENELKYEINLSFTDEKELEYNSALQTEEIKEDDDVFGELIDNRNAIVDDTFVEYIKLFEFKKNEIKDEKDQNPIQTSSKIKVTIRLTDNYDDLNENELAIVLFEDDARKLIKPEVKKENDNLTISFEVDDSVVFALVETTKEIVLTYRDSEYLITVAFTGAAGIPADAKLDVSIYEEKDEVYENAVEKSSETLGEDTIEQATAVKVFDISIRDSKTNEEYQPNNNVKVSIDLLKEEISDNVSVDVLHIEETQEEAQLVESEIVNEKVEFETVGFSVYVVVLTTLDKTLVASDGNKYRVTVSYDNTAGIPENAQLVVEELNKTDKNFDEYVEKTAEALSKEKDSFAVTRVFDITLIDPDTGAHYQPNKNVKVSIELLNEDITDQFDVVHFEDNENDGTGDARVLKSSTTGEKVEFETDGFSIYVLTSGGETVTPQCTYTFFVQDGGLYTEYSFVDDQGNRIYKQTVSDVKELVVPQLPSSDERSFNGWFKGERIGGTLVLDEEPYDFENTKITQDSAVDLYAVFSDFAKVIFHDQYDQTQQFSPTAYTRRAKLDDTTLSGKVKISDLSIEYNNLGSVKMAFLGWSETEVTTPGTYEDEEHRSYVITPDEEGCITVTEETHLYPIFKEIHWLSFFAAPTGQGAAYNGPRRLFIDEGIESLPITSLSGNTFLGWFTGTKDDNDEINYGAQISDASGNLIAGVDDGGAYVANGKMYLRSDVTLYAKWEVSTTAYYKVIFWKQNMSNESSYVFITSEKNLGNVGELVQASNASIINNCPANYTLKEQPAPAEVKIDGSTVINVYYDHNEGYTPAEGDFTLSFVDSITEAGKKSPDLPKTKTVHSGEALAEYIIANPGSGRKGYTFLKWYLDPDCTKEVDFNTTLMPYEDLTLYAGWEVEWYVVTIDPNYGELRPLVDGVPTGTGSTWFWQTVEREPIAEYSYVERNYVQSNSGTWYYVNYAGNGDGTSEWGSGKRYTYYTQNQSEATEDTTFEYAPGTYTYAGWYEQHEDGTETLYDFGQRTDHNTILKLHWKKNGTYYLGYDAKDGTLDNSTIKTMILPDTYVDYAGITLTHSAKAPDGYTFVGWRVQNSNDNVIYKPGKQFTLHADDAKRISGKDVVFLEAVYVKVNTASIIYDANGGTLNGDNIDLGYIPSGTEWVPVSGTVDTDRAIATVSGLTNNTKIRLSDGTGFIKPAGTDAEFLGWSDKAVCDASAIFYAKDSTDTYAVADSNHIYAVWGVKATYSLGSEYADWGEQEWDPTIYTKDGNNYVQDVKVGNKISEPKYVPVYTGPDGRLFRYWATRSGSGSDTDPYVYTEYDFSASVTDSVNLYAYWSEPNIVKVHAIDSSEPTLVDKTEDTDWSVTDITVSTAETQINATSHVTAPENYAFAFAAVADSLASISEKNAITAIKYEGKQVKVKYAGESEFKVLGDDKEVYFVYYLKKALRIGYKSMGSNGTLSNVTVDTAAPAITGLLGAYNMADAISSPLAWASNNYTSYAFAIGNSNPSSVNDLSFLTSVSSSDDTRPALQLRNTWRGFQYSTNGTSWTDCGYVPALYVIYYTQMPTVVMYAEKTEGLPTVIDTQFRYDFVVEEITTTTISQDGQEDIITTDTTIIYDEQTEGYQPVYLKNGERDSAILFYDITSSTVGLVTTTVEIKQRITITQTANSQFTTTVIGDDIPQTETLLCIYTADGNGGTKNVAFTNTHKSVPVEIHIALMEEGGVIQRDTTYRNYDESNYKFDLEFGETVTLLERLSSDTVLRGPIGNYAFGTVLSGKGTNDSAINISSQGIVSVAYEETGDGIYSILLKDADGSIIGVLDDNQLYYLYYPMLKIRYVKEAIDGTLTPIHGCLPDSTGTIEEVEDITYGHAIVTMNGVKVKQGQNVEIPYDGLIISQSGNHFRMPAILDDGLFERYLSYGKIGAGNGNISNISQIDVSDGLTVELKVQDNTLQYSFDGTNWEALSIGGIPTIYAIYDERGYDLEISKAVDLSKSGDDPIFSAKSFELKISSPAITKNSYEIDGGDSSTIPAIPAEGTNPGIIYMTIEDGTKIRIKSLSQGKYTVEESGNENFKLTAKIGQIIGGTSEDAVIIDNSIIKEMSEDDNVVNLNSEKKIDIKNSPMAVCKIDNVYFYTLESMVEYVENQISTKTATAEMLIDYVMPKDDVAEIPSGCNITLTTSDTMGHAAVITKPGNSSDKSFFINHGTFEITSLILDGENVASTVPAIQSSGDLTIGEGAVIQKIENQSSGEDAVYGGAINATAGNITISGTVKNNSSDMGGAIYHSGNGIVTVNKTASIQNNNAVNGNGGAIYLSGGAIEISGTASIANNNAINGNGGAIYAGNVRIEIDQGGTITSNTAKEGGAIYAESGTIIISETKNVSVKPNISGNTASSGNGGALYVASGSLDISGGDIINNDAGAGSGGAIYTNSASVAVSGTAKVNANTASAGGAVYSTSGFVTVSETVDSETGTAQFPDIKNNIAKTNGGAIFAGSGNVTISGGNLSNNRVSEGNGGAIYADRGNITISGENTTVSGNTAKTSGGAIYAENGMVTVSIDSLSNNTATEGSGGAIYAGNGIVNLTDATITGNTAGNNGGAIYASNSAITATNTIFGGQNAGNTAGGSGGAIYASSGNVTISGGSISYNKATRDNGGAIYVGSGASVISNVESITNNEAGRNGGAIYTNSGASSLTSITVTGNKAVNGAALFTNTGRTTFNAGNYSGNIATTGGAVGMGSKNARLYFNSDVKIKNNKLGEGDSAPESNVFLNQDDDAVINIDTLGANASIGIYVPDDRIAPEDPENIKTLVNTRSVPGARFAMYISNSNVSKITNDRFPALTVQTDTAAKKLYWSNAIKVTINKLDAYNASFTQPASSGAGTQLKKYDVYYPELDDAAISELASELVTKDNINIGTTVYAGAYLDGVRTFGDYITNLIWETSTSQWYVTKRDGEKVYLKKTDGTGYHRIYIYYVNPAYISIENNTGKTLTISNMTVNGTSVINTSTVAGYGMVFAKNGAIRSALLPVEAEDLSLGAGASINLLIPGGRNMAYTLDGTFGTNTESPVRLRRTGESEESLVLASDGTFSQITGTTLNSSGTYQITFGSDKNICKVIDASGVEHPYSRISDALTDIKNGTIILAQEKTAVIEMITDYLLPASDKVLIPRGYEITLTTAAKEGVTYPYIGEGNRAIISRDTENTDSMIDAWNGNNGGDTVNALDGTTLRLSNLIFDGKSVRGSSDGGAVKSKYVNVYIDTVDFKNVYASNGGALLIMFSAKDKYNKDTVPGTVLEVKNSDFIGCTSTTTEKSNRLGGGALVTNAETMTLENCNFSNCTAVDQAGAVFHRVDKNFDTWTNISGCTFVNCSANAAGGLELDSKYIEVSDCVFDHCVAKERNGGGFNVWAINAKEPDSSTECSVKVTGSIFNDCQNTTTDTNNGYGGGFRSNSIYTTVKDCTFTNSFSLFGGGFSLSNSKALKAEVYGCTFDRCSANNGGGIYGKPLELIIGDYTDETGTYTRRSEIKNCTSKNEGAGVYYDKDVNNSKLTITNTDIVGNETQNNGKNGGGVYTNARKVEIVGSVITDNKSTNMGGGLYVAAPSTANRTLTISDSEISRNNASSDGAGVWYETTSKGDENTKNSIRNAMSFYIKGSTINNNTSNSNGGGAYCNAKIISIEDYDDGIISRHTEINRNTAANNGGGIYQSLNVDGSRLTITNASINGNTATTGSGGGIYAAVRTLDVTNSSISDNTASGNGGGIFFDINSNRNVMKLSIEGCTLNSNSSGNHGGGIYTMAKEVMLKKHDNDSEGGIPTTISNCIATNSGGGIYHSLDVDGSTLKITNSVIENCISNNTKTDDDAGGGGVFANVRTINITDSEISGNRAVNNGGGILSSCKGNDRYLTIDHSDIIGNISGNKGGGVYSRSTLTLSNGTTITGNHLTNNTVYNAAGVYLINERTLRLGIQSEIPETVDTVIVKENFTNSGVASNVHIWMNNEGRSNEENNRNSVIVYCHLSEESMIGVVNAAKVGTQFGDSNVPNPLGFSDDFSAIKADASTLHGIIDRKEESGTVICWAGPPIAKITDGEGNLLYRNKGRDPAIFDRLFEGSSDTYNKVGAFNMLNSDNPGFYNADGSDYTGNEFIVKMLVENYTTENAIWTLDTEGRKITFTTASKSEDDGYSFVGSSTRATVIRGNGIDPGTTLFVAKTEVLFENIILDGNAENITVGNGSRLLYIDSGNKIVCVGENAVLQNARVTENGGAVKVANGDFTLSGGTIRNCIAVNGGGIYIYKNKTVKMEAGNIYRCYATTNGGGVNANAGNFTMTGGTISYCGLDENDNAITQNGGGIYVANNKTLNMSGGSIINNSAKTSGGGVAVGGTESRLYFSGKVNISGNTRDGSAAPSRACNVELNYDRPTINNETSVRLNGIINTNNGGLLSGSYIGVYVPDGANLYDKHGDELDPFGTFATGDNTSTFYSFVNDRNGLKGGLKENPSPNTIYWIQIFSLTVEKNIITGSSTSNDTVNEELFLFKVNLRGIASAPGQPDAKNIDSSRGDYGEMYFVSNNLDTTTAVFALRDGETISGVNLSEGLTYEVIEYLTLDQAKRYAAMPMNNYSSATETIDYNGTTYTVIKANLYSSKIGENKSRKDVDPYTSRLTFANLMPVCKITDKDGNILYRKYYWDKVTNKEGEGLDGPEVENRPFYYAPAVFTELTGSDSAFNALHETLYTSNSANPISYNPNNGVQIKMVTKEYSLRSPINADIGKVTLTTASTNESLFPKYDGEDISTISRAFADESMITVTNDLTLRSITIDGVKRIYSAKNSGGIVNVKNAANLTIESYATLQYSKIVAKDADGNDLFGGAVYAAPGSVVTMTGGTINNNESDGDGAGIYLAEGSKLYLSGIPGFGGKGVDVSGNIRTDLGGNYKSGELIAQTNGGKSYSKARQDIYIAGYSGPDDSTNAESLIVNGNIDSGSGAIWVWVENSPHYKSLQQFGKYTSGVSNVVSTLAAFRNARDDKTSEADKLGQYLYGITKSDDSGKNIFWYGPQGNKVLILRKINTLYSRLSGAMFSIYASKSATTPISDKNGNVLQNLVSDENGIFYVGDLNYGTYYVKETTAPYGYPLPPDGYYFVITISENGVGYSTDGGKTFVKEVSATY